MDTKKVWNFVIPAIMMTGAAFAAIQINKIWEKQRAKKKVVKTPTK